MYLCLIAIFFIALSNRSISFKIRVDDLLSCTLKAVSKTSDEVSPWCKNLAGGPAYSATLVKNAITSCFTSRSILSIRVGLILALDLIFLAVPFGTVPSCSIASQA